jgi:hypothetical protein
VKPQNQVGGGGGDEEGEVKEEEKEEEVDPFRYSHLQHFNFPSEELLLCN